ncbi:hypothetical protein M9H77_03197 [Catharanthus roseus]|uniref:Uncharacterized protein n=1 Tax=Catharanthus roseus TaxID=4058 RepID=A0ACC0CAQ7_CATRO|nr:hypothetical protein M9H77_03197 [Catharanthus roseus]
MATRRNGRVPAVGIDEALERFLKFRPPEFYGEAEQETKVELFLKQLNDICDTLRYEDALRVTFAAFTLRGTAKEWWLRASKARALKNQPWTWTGFQEEFKKEYIPRWVREQREDELAKHCLRLIDTDENKTRQFVKGLRVELQRALVTLPVMGFAAAIEAATRTEMADQAVTQRKAAIGSAATPYKRHGQGPWKSKDFKRPRGEQRIGNEGRQTLTPEESIEYVYTVDEVDI